MVAGKVSSKQAVAGALFNKERSHILLILRQDVPVWVLPGGGIEPGESPEEALSREMQEETGLEVKITRKIAEYIPVNKLTQFTHFFECISVRGTLTTSPETKAVCFFALDKLPLMPPPYREWIEEAAANLPEIIVKTISSVSYAAFIKAFFTHPILVIRFVLARLGLAINR